jgi:hypothetical protein
MKATPQEQERAQLVAQLMRDYDDLLQQAAGATGSESDWERFHEQMGSLASAIELHVSFSGNRARCLELATEVLKGKKLRGAPHDDVIKKAAKTAIQKAIQERRRTNRKKGRSGVRLSDLRPTFARIDAAYAELTKAIPKEQRLTERQVRRRAEALGYLK